MEGTNGKLSTPNRPDPAPPETMAPVCEHCAIRHRSICGALTAAEVNALNGIAVRRKYSAGQTIQWQDEEAGALGNILSGALKLTRTLEDGRQQIVGLLFPSDFLGRTYSDHAAFNAEAASDVEICTFPRARFEELLHRYPDLESRLLARTLDELDAAREWMLLLGRKSAAEKVATFFLHLARRQSQIGFADSAPEIAKPGGGGQICFRLPLTRADMADYLGLTIETVSRRITHLKKAGIIVVANRSITVEGQAALEQASGD
jgi:CRP/FNR family transcriptional regulator